MMFQRGSGTRKGRTPRASSSGVGGGTVLIFWGSPSREYYSPRM
jgi:hypothetical protein